MFNLFKKKLSISEYAHAAEILPVAEEGDYKAFLIQVPESSANLSAALKASGGSDGLAKFVEIIDNRISSGDFEDIFGFVDQMHADYGTAPKKRNMDVDRIVICKGESREIFNWAP
ncbi:hypothetical protein G6681_05550 [Polynucleobacter paneuropaeus]|nr:hypothetical protein G6681_05550 [Polynucleobacter paneuropaeus]